MAIKITTQAQWHEYQPGVRVKLTQPGRKKIRALLEEAGGDDAKFEELLTDFTINGWEGLVGEDNLPLPLNMEGKKAVRDDAVLGQWIEGRLNRPLLAEEAEIKN